MTGKASKTTKPAKASNAGRSSKLSAEIQEHIVTAIRLGNYQDHAAQSAGIGISTFYSWLERGKKERERLDAFPTETIRAAEKPYVEFLEAVEKAKSEAVQRNIAVIQKAAAVGSWQAAAWWLERTQTALYGRKQQVALQGVEGGPAVQLSVDTQDLEDKVSRILDKRDK
jgi:IS30 family transposase